MLQGVYVQVQQQDTRRWSGHYIHDQIAAKQKTDIKPTCYKPSYQSQYFSFHDTYLADPFNTVLNPNFFLQDLLIKSSVNHLFHTCQLALTTPQDVP